MTMIGLVSCSSQKLDHVAPARELYASSLFRSSLKLAERLCERVYVLSARHGVVSLDQVLAPYNVTLSRMPTKDRVLWGYRCAIQLVALEGALPMNAALYAGREYVEPIEQALRPLRWKLHDPMRGLQIGERLAWLVKQLAASEHDARSVG